MRHFRHLFVLLTILTVFSSCEKDEIEPTDNLEQFGILGKWGLQSITINGITDMSLHYDTLEFKPDSEISDLKGEFTTSGAGYETNGVFVLNSVNNTIQFDYDDTQKLYEFQISDNLINFAYSEDNHEIIESWRKEE